MAPPACHIQTFGRQEFNTEENGGPLRATGAGVTRPPLVLHDCSPISGTEASQGSQLNTEFHGVHTEFHGEAK